MKVTLSPQLFPIINEIGYCKSDSVMIFPLSSYEINCEFNHISGCFCNIAAPTSFEFIAISPESVKVELADYISKLDSSRKLELITQAGPETLPRNESGTASEDRFDIGVVTHAILVILSFISFAGNALFVVYVFWLSR
jgi:hypothetical protein